MYFSSSSTMKKKTHFGFIPILIILVVFGLREVDSQATTDADVMNAMKKSLGISEDIWTGSDPCSWKTGVQCSTDNRVIKIQLKDGTITGTLPSNLNSLTSLQHLEFRGPQIQIGGALPTLKGLSAMQVVLLSLNNFTSIPDDFFEGLTSLENIALDSLPLAPWRIPMSLQTCSSLANFSANTANIIGKIPEFFDGGVFVNLVELHLSGNKLEGGLPSNLSTLTSLQSLWLNGQNLNGTIEVIQNMTSLNQLWLNRNSLTGPLPEFGGLQSLSDLNLRDNQFTGPVPGSLRILKSLTSVELTNNLLQGDFPQFAKSVQVDNIIGTNSFCLDVPGNCSADVSTMLLIGKNWGYPAPLADNWKGNSPCQWSGITCNGDKIIVINFLRKGLTGTISPYFSSFQSLEILNLADNNLFGTIPSELADLPNVTSIDLSNNHLSGRVPDMKNGIIKTEGNPDIGNNVDSPPSPGTPQGGSVDPQHGGNPGRREVKKSSISVSVIVGCVAASFVVVVLGLVGWCLYKRRGKSGRVPNAMVVHPHHSGSDPDMVKITVASSNINVGAASDTNSHASSGPSDIQMVEAGNMVISIQVLRNVTNNFSDENVLGRGGFGTVYKGELHDGTKIAVKRMESGVMGSKGLTEFKSEIAVLNKVRHRHLVSLIGYCLDGNERILVYEYMPQGTLSQHLFNWKDEGLKPLEWTRRLTIALDVARGVEYLHGLASQSFIHRDLKPSNILLGDDMRAKVADFGLVRLAPEGKASIETRLAGTFGYLAPEYAATGRVTTKVDVYAFGVILMELITGRKALDESQPEESMHLVTWFRRMSINKDTFPKAIDTTINMDEEALASVSTISELAGYCCSREPHQRPDMGHVVNVLSSLAELWKPSDTDPEDIYAIDMELSLAQTLKKWQAFDGDTSDTSSFLASIDNTQTSIPTRPSGFADSFTSADGR